MKYLICTFLFYSLFSISCNDEKEVYSKEALLKWQGSYAVDGCGFFLEIDDKDYKPENENFISDDYKENDSTYVIVKFRYLDEKIKYYCGRGGVYEIEGVHIVSINKISVERH